MKRPNLTPERRAELLNRLDANIHETARVAQIAHDASAIYDAYSEDFSRKTGLTKLDWGFLFTATALQMLRQYLLTALPERLDDQKAAEKVEGKEQLANEKKGRKEDPRHHRYYKPSLKEILIHPVPFDANVGASGALKGGGAYGHRGATPGHDPAVGLIVGTANIATATLTNWTFESWHITSGARKNGGMQDVFGNHANTAKIFYEVYDKIANQGAEGKAKMAAALAKEVVHLRTDVNTAKGLPLPFLQKLSPEFSSWLASYGADFGNVVGVGKQAAFATLINTLVAMLHGMFYDAAKDGDEKLYKVRTKKIIIYSNAIASATNALAAWYTGNAKLLDFGGYAVALYQLVTGVDFIERVRRDFITGEFDKLVNQQANKETAMKDRTKSEEFCDIAMSIIPVAGAVYHGRKGHKEGFQAASEIYERKFREMSAGMQQFRNDVFGGEHVLICPESWDEDFWAKKMEVFVKERAEGAVEPRRLLLDFLDFCIKTFPPRRLAQTRADLETIRDVIGATKSELATKNQEDIELAIDFLRFYRENAEIKEMKDELVATLPGTNGCNFLVLGKTGVGKSSLLNRLLGVEKFSTGTGRPVTGKEIIESEGELDGFKVRVFDSWGLEAGQVTEWLKLLEENKKKHDLSHKIEDWYHAVVYCVSAGGHRIEDVDRDIVRSLLQDDLYVVVALTKSDACNEEDADTLRRELVRQCEKLRPENVIETCAGGKTRSGYNKPFGIKELKRAILANYKKTILAQLPLRCIYLAQQKIEDFKKETLKWIESCEWKYDENENTVPLKRKCDEFANEFQQEIFPGILKTELEACAKYARNLATVLRFDDIESFVPHIPKEKGFWEKIGNFFAKTFHFFSYWFGSSETATKEERDRLVSALNRFCNGMGDSIKRQKAAISDKVKEVLKK